MMDPLIPIYALIGCTMGNVIRMWFRGLTDKAISEAVATTIDEAGIVGVIYFVWCLPRW